MSPNVITELRLGRRNGVSTKNIQKIANYFGVTVGYLLGEEEKENNPVETDELKLLIDSLSEKKREQLVQYAKFLASQKD